jgi:predicted pyridoxine 5'-phosphate oxidase superfamily flavin-nucleotide-binding protein
MSGGFNYTSSLLDNPSGKLRTFAVPVSHASLIAVGDVVRVTGTADADGNPQVDVATATQSVTGVISSIVPDFATENFTDISLAASRLGTVRVIVDPHGEFEVDVSNGPLLLLTLILTLIW